MSAVNCLLSVVRQKGAEMNLSIGIVGLPNVGKSTMFNALLGQHSAEASNYPFCTIEPNTGIVAVPDIRLEQLAKAEGSKKIIPATIKFVDIAGLVAGASKGEGLGNKFLANIRETDAICMVLRIFEDHNIVHVAGAVDPVQDAKTIMLELILSDLESLEKQVLGLEKKTRGGDKEAQKKLELIKKIKPVLEKEEPAINTEILGDDLLLAKHLQLLTLKPIIIAVNSSESQIKDIENNENYKKIIAFAKTWNAKVVPIAAKLENDLIDFGEESGEYLAEAGVKTKGLDELIQASYEILGLISFFTVGPEEARAWTIKNGFLAPRASAEIHNDFEKHFIKADVVAFTDFVNAGGWAKAKEKGMIKMQGRDYVVKNGDVLLIKHSA